MRMRKVIVLATLMLTLMTLMALMPVVKAVTYVWQGVHFVEGYEGEWIKYPHPDRDYYEISPYSKWSKKGWVVYHNQIDHATSAVAKESAIVFCATVGAILGAKFGGWVGAGLGALAGGVLGLWVTWVSELYFFDELDCIWWWIGSYFWDWLIENAVELVTEWLINPSLAEQEVLLCFCACGYLRVGSITFANPIGIADPEPPPSDGNGDNGGGCPVLSVYDGSEYVEEGSLNIHSAEDTVVYRELTVTPEEMNQKYYLRLTEPDLPESHSYIDQVKLLALDGSGETVTCPLVGAEHSEDGNVLYELLLSDDVRTDTEPYEYIDLTFVAPTGEIEDLTFVIEGYNIKPPWDEPP